MAKNKTKDFKLTATAKERLDNFMVYSTIVVFAFALFMVVLQNLSKNYMYVLSVQTLQQGIKWISLAGSVVFIVLSFVKKKPKTLGIAACLAISVLMFAVYHIDTGFIPVGGYGLAYIAMGLYLVFVYVYCWLKESGRFLNKRVQKTFMIAALAAAGIILLCIALGYGAQLAAIRAYQEGYSGSPLTGPQG